MIESLVRAMEEYDRFEEYSVKVALVREPHATDRPQLDHPAAVFDAFKVLARLDRECVAVALLDGAHRLNAIHAVHFGTVNQAPVGMSDVFKAAILSNASGVILVHNHPSGRLEPSADDLELTRRVKDAGKLLGIPLLDHVIVAGDGYFSFLKNDKL